jgi:hypothetical protein
MRNRPCASTVPPAPAHEGPTPPRRGCRHPASDVHTYVAMIGFYTAAHLWHVGSLLDPTYFLFLSFLPLLYRNRSRIHFTRALRIFSLVQSACVTRPKIQRIFIARFAIIKVITITLPGYIFNNPNKSESLFTFRLFSGTHKPLSFLKTINYSFTFIALYLYTYCVSGRKFLIANRKY